MVDFNSILSKPMAKVEAPKTLPVGNYLTQVGQIGAPRQAKDFQIIEIPLIVQSAMEDVDPDSLAEYGNVAGEKLTRSFFFGSDDKNNQRSEYELKMFLTEHLKIEMGKKSLGEALSEAPGAVCITTVKWDQDSNDANINRARVKGTAPAD